MYKYCKFPIAALYDNSLTKTDLRVLGMLCDMANENGECWPSQAYIADKLAIKRQTINSAIQTLKSKNYINDFKTNFKKVYIVLHLKGCHENLTPCHENLTPCHENLTGVSAKSDRGVISSGHPYIKIQQDPLTRPKEQEPPKPPKVKIYSCPPDWEPDNPDNCFDYGEKLGFSDLEMDREMVKFRDHFSSKPNIQRAGWDLSYKNWLCRTQKGFERKKSA